MFIQENAFENVVCEMSAILCRPQCVNVGMWVLLYIGLPYQMLNCNMMTSVYVRVDLTHWPLGKLERKFRHVIFKQILVIGG